MLGFCRFWCSSCSQNQSATGPEGAAMHPMKLSGGTTRWEETHGKNRDSELCLPLNRLEGVPELTPIPLNRSSESGVAELPRAFTMQPESRLLGWSSDSQPELRSRHAGVAGQPPFPAFSRPHPDRKQTVCSCSQAFQLFRSLPGDNNVQQGLEPHGVQILQKITKG